MPTLDGIGDLDTILITVAVLFEPLTTQSPIAELDVIKVLKRPVNIGQTITGSLIVSSTRDRIEIVVSPNKIDVRGTSESISEEKDRLPGLLRYFLELLGNPELQLLGLNFVLEGESKEAQQWIADKTIGAKIREQTPGAISSKSASMTFQN